MATRAAPSGSRPKLLGRFRLLAGAALGIGLFLGVTDLGRDVRTAAPVSLDLAASLGLKIDRIVVTGNEVTTEENIVAALNLGRHASMLGIDLASATARLEVLPLIESVVLTRKWPASLQVAVIERKAVAVWHDGERYHLMDKDGRGLGVVQAATRLDLPRYAGIGAPDALPELRMVLDRHPDIRDNIRLAERIEQSRWDLHFENGVTLQLPVGEVAAALKLYKQLVAQGIDPAIVEIDLRHPARVAVVSRPQRAVETGFPMAPNGS